MFQVYIIDFGLVKRYRDSGTNCHIPYRYAFVVQDRLIDSFYLVVFPYKFFAAFAAIDPFSARSDSQPLGL